MSNQVNIAVDCMGGDDNASFVLPGLLLSLKKYPKIKFQLYGDEEIIRSRIQKYRALEDVSQIIHCDTHVKMDEKPSLAIKNGRGKSSIWVAIEALKHGNADFMISAGIGSYGYGYPDFKRQYLKFKGLLLRRFGQLLMEKLLF